MIDLAVIIAQKGRREYQPHCLAALDAAARDIECNLTMVSTDGDTITPPLLVDLPRGQWNRGYLLNEAFERAPDARFYLILDVDIVLHPLAIKRAMASAKEYGLAVLGGYCLDEQHTQLVFDGKQNAFACPVTAESATIDRQAEYHGVVMIAEWHLAELRNLCGKRFVAEFDGWGCEDSLIIGCSQIVAERAGRKQAAEYLHECWRHLWHPQGPGKPVVHGDPTTGDEQYRKNRSAYLAALEAYRA